MYITIVYTKYFIYIYVYMYILHQQYLKYIVFYVIEQWKRMCSLLPKTTHTYRHSVDFISLSTHKYKRPSPIYCKSRSRHVLYFTYTHVMLGKAQSCPSPCIHQTNISLVCHTHIHHYTLQHPNHPAWQHIEKIYLLLRTIPT